VFGAHVLDVTEPVVREADPSALEGRFHATAAVVTDDHNVFHFEHIDRVLNDREAIEVGVNDDVGDIAMHEHLAGEKADDLVGGNAAIGAADPEVFRLLLVGEFAEETGVFLGDGFCPLAVLGEERGERVHGVEC